MMVGVRPFLAGLLERKGAAVPGSGTVIPMWCAKPEC